MPERRAQRAKSNAAYSRISDGDMKLIMTSAVNRLYALLQLKADDPAGYARQIDFGEQYTAKWDDPE
jgi:hypothetical protein